MHFAEKGLQIELTGKQKFLVKHADQGRSMRYKEGAFKSIAKQAVKSEDSGVRAKELETISK